jgi:2-amino-4-hydroxy-6-hydroxymethyldihydropteridine diphosphokinase
MMTTYVYLSLGSNLGDRLGNLRAAVAALRQVGALTALSSVYATEPVGVTDQPSFLNIALAAETERTPRDLLDQVKRIEAEVGRRPTYRWGPRVIDIDIILYDELVLDTPELVIPHPEMANRAFVLVPLAEIAPHVIHPVLQVSMEELRDRAPDRDTVLLYAPAAALDE